MSLTEPGKTKEKTDTRNLISIARIGLKYSMTENIFIDITIPLVYHIRSPVLKKTTIGWNMDKFKSFNSLITDRMVDGEDEILPVVNTLLHLPNFFTVVFKL